MKKEKKRILLLRHAVSALMLACAMPGGGAAGWPMAVVCAMPMPVSDMLESITLGVDFAKDLEAQGFIRIMTTSETGLMPGDIILSGGLQYGWLGEGKAVDLSSKTERTYVFAQGDEFYRFRKLSPSYIVPSSRSAVYGDALGSILLPDGFAWSEPETVLLETGSHKFEAVYTPDNTLMYQSVQGVRITVEVSKKKVSPSVPENQYSVPYTEGLTLGSIHLPDGWAFDDPDQKLTVATYSRTARFTGDTEHYEFDITQKQVTVEVKKGYAVRPPLLPVTVPEGTFLDDLYLPAAETGAYSWETLEIVTEPGPHTVVFTPNDTSLYLTEMLQVQVNVSVKLDGDTPDGDESDIDDPAPSQTLKPSSIVSKTTTKYGSKKRTSRKSAASTSAGASGNTASLASEDTSYLAPEISSSHGGYSNYGGYNDDDDEGDGDEGGDNSGDERTTGSTPIRSNTSGSFLSAKTLEATNKSRDDVVVKKSDSTVAVAKKPVEQQPVVTAYETLIAEDGSEYYHLYHSPFDAEYFYYDADTEMYLSCNPDGTKIVDGEQVTKAEFESAVGKTKRADTNQEVKSKEKQEKKLAKKEKFPVLALLVPLGALASIGAFLLRKKRGGDFPKVDYAGYDDSDDEYYYDDPL